MGEVEVGYGRNFLFAGTPQIEKCASPLARMSMLPLPLTPKQTHAEHVQHTHTHIERFPSCTSSGVACPKGSRLTSYCQEMKPSATLIC